GWVLPLSQLAARKGSSLRKPTYQGTGLNVVRPERVPGQEKPSVPLAEMVAAEWLEISTGIRRLKAAPASWSLRPPPFGHSTAKPCFRRVRGSMVMCTIVTLDP